MRWFTKWNEAMGLLRKQVQRQDVNFVVTEEAMIQWLRPAKHSGVCAVDRQGLNPNKEGKRRNSKTVQDQQKHILNRKG
jgi:hypothetical protein